MTLYKYIPPERIDILQNSYIRFTQPSAFNDPFEAFPYFKSLAPEMDIAEFVRKKNRETTSADIEKILKESWEKKQKENPNLKVPFSVVKEQMMKAMNHATPIMSEFFINFMTMKGPAYRKIALESMLNSINQEVGILCLAMRPDNLLMWAHYSANHTGLVLEFDDKHPFFNTRPNDHAIGGFLKAVSYTDKRPKLIFMDPNISKEQNIKRWVERIFFVKSIDWDYEQEWRMIHSLRECKRIIKDDSGNVYLFPFPEDSLTGVYLGCKISTNFKKKLSDIIKNKPSFSHVKMRQAEIDEKEYMLNFTEI